LKKNLLWIILISAGLLLLLAIYLVLSTLNLNVSYYISIGWVIIVIILLWVGNSIISKGLNKTFPWLQYGNLRLVTQLFSTLFYSLIIINASYLLFKSIFTTDPPILTQIIILNVYGIVLILPVVSIYFGVHFLRSWRKSEIEAETFQKESIRSQLEALKNHLDPHFLFNNLNILSSLIDKDKEQSKAYLDKFAEVYRVILQSNTTEPIPLSQELDFIETYMYLIKIRFEDAIKLEIDIDEKLKGKMLPPLTIQMLVENAIKHNQVTETKPLYINISSEGNDFIVVRNNLQPKKNPVNENGSGIKNIISRYSYFTDQKIVKTQNVDHFMVKVPLIDIEEV